MPLESGTELGHYQILSKLGEGGMGEVYLALDERLGRKIALKILPAELAAKQERMARFVREAKAAAALNHPNIAHIYEIGEEDGVHLIAMEFVDGQTLRQKIRWEQADLRKLLRYLQQVAEGLTKAHAAGIVHRDLKPDNIMISRDGFAKILDFGLVKLIEPTVPPGQQAASDEVATAVHSLPGTVMGTVGYMSPEQAKGKINETDHRSDIFSFGCILFEAITGQKAFDGKDTIDSLNKIIREPVPPISSFKPAAPSDLQRIVRRCLAKDREERYQSIKEVAIELNEVLREVTDSVGFATTVPPASLSESIQQRAETISIQMGSAITNPTRNYTPTPPSSAEYVFSQIKQHKIGTALTLAILAAVIAGAGFALYKFVNRRESSGPVSLASAKLTRLTTTGKATGVAISPDGKFVVYIQDDGGQQSLSTRQVATQSNVQIVAPAAVQYSGLTFSPDGNYIYYTAFSQELAQAVLFQVPPLGGVPKKLLENVATLPVTFSPDGKQLAFVRPTPREEFTLMIANADGAEERKIVQYQNPPEAISAPAWSPDGKRIAYRLGNFESNDSSVFETQIADGATKPLTAQRWLGIGGLTWLADGSGLLVLATTGQQFVYQIWHLSYPEGEARQLTNDLNNYLGMSLASDSGSLAVVQSEQQASIWVAPTSDSSRARPVTSGTGKADTSLAWTPDGRIVYQSNAGGSNIWIMGADGAGAKQLTANARINQLPEVSPDGRYIVFLSYRTGVPHLWRMNIDGSDPRQLAKSASGESSARFSPDGRWLVYRTALGRWTVWKMPADGSGEPVQLTDKYSRSPAVSPDGKLIAYFYREDTGPWRIVVVPFEGGGPLKAFDIPALPTPSLRWTPDGRALAYVHTRSGVSNIVAQPLDGGNPKPLTDFKADRIFSFAYSSDGKQLALSRGTVNNDVVLISNFK